MGELRNEIGELRNPNTNLVFVEMYGNISDHNGIGGRLFDAGFIPPARTTVINATRGSSIA